VTMPGTEVFMAAAAAPLSRPRRRFTLIVVARCLHVSRKSAKVQVQGFCRTPAE
jgi:hypothetical protein